MKYNLKAKESSIYDFWIDQLIAGTIDFLLDYGSKPHTMISKKVEEKNLNY